MVQTSQNKPFDGAHSADSGNLDSSAASGVLPASASFDRRTFFHLTSAALASSALPSLSVLGTESGQTTSAGTQRGAGPVEIIKVPKNSGTVRAPYGGDLVQDMLDHWPEPRAGTRMKSAAVTIQEFRANNYLPTTHAHELLHAMQEALRQRYAVGTKLSRSIPITDPTDSSRTFSSLSTAAVYLGQGNVIFVPTPENVSLRDVIQSFPRSLKIDPYFDMYIVGPSLINRASQKDFSLPQPTSYLIDEFSCKHFGAEMAFGLVRANEEFNKGRRNEQGFFDPGLEPLALFALGLSVLSARQGVKFSQNGDAEQFFGAVKLLVERSLWLNSEVARSPEMQSISRSSHPPGRILGIFINSQDCRDFREQVKDIFGPELYERLKSNPFDKHEAPVANFKELNLDTISSSGAK